MATNVAQPIAEKARLIGQAERECSVTEAAAGSDAAGGRCRSFSGRSENEQSSLLKLGLCSTQN